MARTRAHRIEAASLSSLMVALASVKLDSLRSVCIRYSKAANQTIRLLDAFR